MPKTTIKPMLNIRKDTPNDRYTLIIQILCRRRRGVVFTPFKLLRAEFNTSRCQAIPSLKNREHLRFIANVNNYLRHQVHELHRLGAGAQLPTL